LANPTQTTIKRLFAQSGEFCTYPGCGRHVIERSSGTIMVEVCHINARSPGGPRYDSTQTDKERNAYDNLILLCGDHHKLVDSQPEQYPAEELRRMKQAHELSFGRSEQAGDTAIAKMILQFYAQNFSVERVSGDIIFNGAKTVNIRPPAKRIYYTPLAGTIGADQQLVRYIEHLIQRYNEFASKDPHTTRKFSHGAIRKNIDKEFGAVWQKLPVSKAEAVMGYLQKRIDRTSIAKNNKSKGYPAYSSYQEYLAKYDL